MDSDECWDNVNIVKNDNGEHNHINTITDEDSKIKTFRVKNYIPKKSTKELLELPQIIGIAIIFVLIMVIIILSSIKSKSVTPPQHTVAIVTEDVNASISAEIVMSDGNQFWMYNPQTGSLKLIWKVKNYAQAFVFDTRKTLYWIETNTWKVFSVDLSKTEIGKNKSLFFQGSSAKPLKNPSMALDTINNNLYIVDESIIGLAVINIETKYYALMTIDLVNPRYIALDEAKGVMFISSKKWIKSADMDGNNVSIIIDGKSIKSLTLDPEEERIYWIHDSEVIESSDYSGQQKQNVLTDLSVIDLIFLHGHLYRLRKSSDIQRKTMWSCEIQNGVCVNHTEHSNAVGTATFMRVPAVHRSNRSSQQNSSNRQNCEHISLATRSGHMSCVCNMSFHLVFDTKCETITEFVVYTLNGDVRARSLDMSKKIILEPIWPTPYYARNLSEKKYIDFEYDFENDGFYFSDDSEIYKIKLKGINPQQEVVLSVNLRDFRLGSLAYDWLSENMYYLKFSKIYRNDISIVVFNVKKGAGYRKTLTEKYSAYYDYNRNYCSLVACPSRGIIFLFDRNGFVKQLKMDGTLILKTSNLLYEGYNIRPAIDFEEDRLYTLSGSYIQPTYSLVHANFNGTDYKRIRVQENLFNIKSIFINRQWVYLSNDREVWRVNKETGVFGNLVSPQYDGAPCTIDSGARVINQTQVKENPCRVSNGDCEQFCFYGPKATCGCADELQVTSEGRCVIKDNP